MRFTCLVTVIILLHVVPFTFAQDITTLEHGGSVQAVAFSPVDSTFAASAGGHNTIKLWNLRENTFKELTHHKDKVNSVAFSPDGKSLISGSDDSSVKIWDVSQWENIGIHEPITIRMPSPVDTVAFHPDGQLLATSGRHVTLLDITHRTKIATLQHDAWAWIVDFSSDGKHLATDDGTGTTVKIWDIQQRQITVTLEGHTSDINFVKFSPDNRTFASSSWDGEVKLWSVSNWEPLGTLQTNVTAAIDFSPDGKTLASAGVEEITLWSVASGAKITTLPGHTGWIRGVAFSPDGTTLASGGEGGTVRIQNIENLSESTPPPNIVRLIYFLPSDRTAQPDIDSKIDTLIKATQMLFADTMEKHGYGRKTFTYETDAEGNALVHHITGKYTDAYYNNNDKWKVWDEIREVGIDPTQNIYVNFMDFSEILDGAHCGTGGNWEHGGVVNLVASEECLGSGNEDSLYGGGLYGVTLVAHEIGHAFGLQHDYRTYPSLGEGEDPMVSSAAAAQWLDVHPYFNKQPPHFNEPTTIEMWPPRAADSGSIHLRFTITDLDGLHQAQLLATILEEGYFAGRDYAEEQDYLDQHIVDQQSLNGSTTTVEFITAQFTADNNTVVLRVIDVNGDHTEGRFPIDTTALPQHIEDVNGDHTVNVRDLVLVAINFGKTGKNVADVSEDGIVNILDLILVAGAFGNAAAAPSAWHHDLDITATPADVQQWLDLARQANLTDPAFQRGILMLEQLLATLTPRKTTLLPNYPNPFNPETWIPYHLAKPAEVSLAIYSVDGKLIRALDLGHQAAGIYESRSRAAYWDGRNALGEPVASGVYFYTLSAGDFTATRKMLIRK